MHKGTLFAGELQALLESYQRDELPLPLLADYLEERGSGIADVLRSIKVAQTYHLPGRPPTWDIAYKLPDGMLVHDIIVSKNPPETDLKTLVIRLIANG